MYIFHNDSQIINFTSISEVEGDLEYPIAMPTVAPEALNHLP